MPKTFFCDFETCAKDNVTKVWLACSLDESGNYNITTSIEEFLNSFKKSSTLYFHNLKFDGSYIVHYLLTNGFQWTANSKQINENEFFTIIDEYGSWYKIVIKYGKVRLTIFDSLKIIPLSIDKIAKSFNVDKLKGEIDYTSYREDGYVPTEEEIDYIKNDCYILSKGLQYFREQNLTKMTIASNAFNYFKDNLPFDFRDYFPVIPIKMDTEIRKYYRGGFCYTVKEYAGKVVKDVKVFDVNSLYPFVMANRTYPCGYPKHFKGEYKGSSECYLQHIRTLFVLKDGYLPTIQIKHTNHFLDTEYLIDSDGVIVDLYLTNIDLQLFLEHYSTIYLEYVDGYEFYCMDNLFTTYVEYWGNVKRNSTGGLRELAKLMLNSLYGKFALNPTRISKIPMLDEDTNSLKYHELPPDVGKPNYTAVAVFVTSYARQYTITHAQKYYAEHRFLYGDTDSLHVLEGEREYVDEHDTELGKWKLEKSYKYAKYLHAKCYMGLKEGDIKDIKVAGLPKDENINKVLTLDNFCKGFTYGNVLKAKQVNGGTLLVERSFTIK